jgi:BlaI family transcriptional regulator, penicillinase repressor
MTTRSVARASVRVPLAELESHVMHIVWEHAPCTVEAVHRKVSAKRKLKETSVRTILRRLEAKGYVRHHEEGRAYVYTAAQTARNLAAHAVRQIIDRFCRGSVEELVTGMVDAKVLTNSEIERLEQFVRARKEKK